MKITDRPVAMAAGVQEKGLYSLVPVPAAMGKALAKQGGPKDSGDEPIQKGLISVPPVISLNNPKLPILNLSFFSPMVLLQDNVDGFHDGYSGSQPITSCTTWGWAKDNDNLGYRVSVRAMTDYGHAGVYSTQIASSTANAYRSDLTGICTGGYCSYSMDLKFTAPVINSPFNVRVDALSMEGHWVPLNNSPKTLTCTDTSVPATPIYDSNSGGVTNNSWFAGQSLTFNWHGTNNASGIDYYNVYWGTNPFGTTSVQVPASPSNTYASWTASSHSQIGPWYFRARTHSRDGQFSPWTTLITYYWGTPPPSFTETILSNPNNDHICTGAWKTNYNQTLPYEPTSGAFQNWYGTGYVGEAANFTSVPSVGWDATWNGTGWGKIASIGSYACGYNNNGTLYRQWLSVPVPSGYAIDHGTLSIMADDAAAVYINGNRLTANSPMGNTLTVPAAWINPSSTLFAAQIWNYCCVDGSQWQMTVTLKDVTAPNNPTSATESHGVTGSTWTAIATPSFTLYGAADPGGSGVAGYNAYWGTDQAGTSGTYQTGNTFSTSIATSGTYYLRVQTKDNAGNWSTWKTIFIYWLDVTPPNDPWQAADLTGVGPNCTPTLIHTNSWQNICNHPSFSWDSALNDTGSGINGYFVYWGTEPSGTSTSYQPNSTFDPDVITNSGFYYLRIRAKDNVGNLAPYWSSLYYFKYDNTPPANPSSGSMPYCYGAYSNTWQNQCPTGQFIWTLGVDEQGGSGIAGSYVYFGPDPAGTSTYFTSAVYMDPSKGYVSLDPVSASGSYYLRISEKDNTGNQTPWVTVFTDLYDITAPTNPTVSSTGCAQAIDDNIWQSTCNDANFTWTGATDIHSNVAGYYIYWGKDPNGVPTTYQTSSAYDPLPVTNGAYYLRIQTIDRAGYPSTLTSQYPANKAPIVTLFTFKYNDGTPPTLQNLEITPSGSATNLYLNGSTLYYGPLSSGDFQVAVSTGESGITLPIGLSTLTFPDTTSLGNTIQLNGTTTPATYNHIYSVTPNSTAIGAYNVTLLDQSSPIGRENSLTFNMSRDVSRPISGGVTISASPGAKDVSLNGTKVLYGPNASGTLTFSVNPSDAGSGLKPVRFPALFNTQQTDISGGPYTLTYSIDASHPSTGDFTIMIQDQVGNTVVGGNTFTLIEDNIAPTVQLNVPDHFGLITTISWSGIDNFNGIGLKSYTVEKKVGTSVTFVQITGKTLKNEKT